MTRHLLILLTFLFQLSVCAQADTITKIAYNNEYVFQEGIYPRYTDLIKSHPIPKSRLLANDDFQDSDFFRNLTSKKLIRYYDDFGNLQEIKTSEIWGYVSRNTVYINVDDEFFRVTYFGNISHFLATYTYYTTPTYNYYNSYNYRSMSPTSQSKEVKQMLFDFSTGKLIDFSVRNMESLLVRDTELYMEFQKLRNKKKKEQLFIFLRKYNERNPLYLMPERNY